MNTETPIDTETKPNGQHADTNGREGNGKIARLPRQIREMLNRRLADNEPGETLLAWLNGLPEVNAVLARDFQAKPITKQNLSEWRTRSFQRWLTRQELIAEVQDLAAVADEATVVGRDNLLAQLATVLAMRYGSLLMRWDEMVNGSLENEMRILHGLNRNVAALRRGELDAARFRVANPGYDRESVAERASRLPLTEAMAAEKVAAPSPKPEVRNGGPVQPAAPSVKPSPTQSNQTKPQPVVPKLDLRLADDFALPCTSVSLHQQKPNWLAQPQSWKGINKAAV